MPLLLQSLCLSLWRLMELTKEVWMQMILHMYSKQSLIAVRCNGQVSETS